VLPDERNLEADLETNIQVLSYISNWNSSFKFSGINAE